MPFLAERRDAFRVERRQHRDALSFPRAGGMAAQPIADPVPDIRLQHGSGVRARPDLQFPVQVSPCDPAGRTTLTQLAVD